VGPAQQRPALKVVLDTNTVISALYHHGDTRRLSDHWRQGRLRLLASPAIVAEYVRVMAYPKFQADPDTAARTLNADLLPFLTPATPFQGNLPAPCRDPDDDAFLRAALGGRADWLITGDKALLTLHGRYPFEILRPGEALRRLSG